MCRCKEQEWELIPELEYILREDGYSRQFENDYEEEFENDSRRYEFEAPVAPACDVLTSKQLPVAVRANLVQAKEIGWACLSGGKVQPIQQLLDLFKFPSIPSEEDFACAVAKWQTGKRIPGSGILDARTWNAMNLITPMKYQMKWDVYYGGKKLGILEKATPYIKCYRTGTGPCSADWFAAADSGGVEIEFGFRITDMDAVRKAGFVDDKDQPVFRWIQSIETNRKLDQGTQTLIKKYSKYVDPNPVAGKFDKHPYYWNEAGEGTDPDLRVTRYTNTASLSNGLCYDLIFYDRPSRPIAESTAGKRVFWNAEVALVGVKKNKRNVILDAITWGFDLVHASGKVEVKRNALARGQRGGSTLFRSTLESALTAGQFPDHCFASAGFGKAVTCK